MARVDVIQVARPGGQGPIGPEGPEGSLAPLVDFTAESGRYGIASGFLITDTVRAADVEGDGKTQPDGSTGIYKQYTNLIPNGGFEFDTSYWAGVFASLITDTTQSKFGAKSAKVTVTSSGQTVIVRTENAIPNPVAGPYTFPIWIWAEGNVIGKTVSLYLYESGGATADGIVESIIQSTVLVAGWNEVWVTATITAADRTGLSCRLQITGLISGDIFWIDGARCTATRFVLPYAETTGQSDPYAPSPDIATNGSFEVNTTGWSASLATIAQDTIHFKEGTKSLKVTVTSAGSAYAAHLTFVTGAPLAQVLYGVGGWVWAEGTVVGKTVQFSLTESGGAQATAAISNVSRTLEAGWNYILLSGTPAQSDRTALRIYCYLFGAVIGDIFWIDDFRAGANYVAAPLPTVTKTNGRLRVSPSRIRTEQGWFAFRLRPAWEGTPVSARDRRTDIPLTLWRWYQNVNAFMRLFFDGAYLRFERRGPNGVDTASTPWCPVKGATSLIVVMWDATGVTVSADGRGLSGVTEVITSDPFDRADGVLGSTPQGFAWIPSGASTPRILDGRMEPHASNTGNGYAYLDLGEIPYRWGGVVGYTGSNVALNTTQAYENPADASLFDLMHMLFHQTGWRHQNRIDGGAFYNGVSHAYSGGPIPTDGTPTAQMIAVDGDTVAVEEPGGGMFAVKHPDIPSLLFPRVFWEVHRFDGSQITRWESIVAHRKTSTPSGSGNIPFILSTTLIDLGSDGTSGTNFSGDILWYAAGRDVMTSGIVTSLNALGDNPLDSQIIGLLPDTTQLWDADDV